MQTNINGLKFPRLKNRYFTLMHIHGGSRKTEKEISCDQEKTLIFDTLTKKTISCFHECD